MEEHVSEAVMRKFFLKSFVVATGLIGAALGQTIGKTAVEAMYNRGQPSTKRELTNDQAWTNIIRSTMASSGVQVRRACKNDGSRCEVYLEYDAVDHKRYRLLAVLNASGGVSNRYICTVSQNGFDCVNFDTNQPIWFTAEQDWVPS